MDIKKALADLTEKQAWMRVTDNILTCIDACLPVYFAVNEKRASLPDINVWYNPNIKSLYFNIQDDVLKNLPLCKQAFADVPNTKYLCYSSLLDIDKLIDNGFIPFQYGSTKDIFTKKAELEAPPTIQPEGGSQPFKIMAHLGGWKPNFLTNQLGGPNALTALIGSTLLGGGLGYGVGTLAEHLVPEDSLEKGRLRRNLGLAGALAGVGIPSLYALARYRSGLPAFGKFAEDINSKLDKIKIELNGNTKKALYDLISPNNQNTELSINSNNFNRTVWSPADQFTPPPIRATAAAVVNGAAQSRNSLMASPNDVAQFAGNIAMNAGSLFTGAATGFAGGYIGGKILGALAGLKEPYQQKLQQMGMWSGLLSKAIPMIVSR